MWTEKRLKIVLLCGLAIGFIDAFRIWYSEAAPAMVFVRWVWPVMVLHECEELVFTAWFAGERQSFFRWVRSVGYELSVSRIAALNLFIAWPLGISAELIGPYWVGIPMFIIAGEAVNGSWHLAMTTQYRRWSPGTLSSVLVTIPFTFAFFYVGLSRDWIQPLQAVCIFLCAVLSHHLFLSSLPRRSESALS